MKGVRSSGLIFFFSTIFWISGLAQVNTTNWHTGEPLLTDYFIVSVITYEGSGKPFLGDYDMDGDLDILITTNTSTTVFENRLSEGSGFTDINAGMPDTYSSDCAFAWGDYDNDGDLDIAYTGYNGNLMAKIFKNNNGIFQDIDAGFQGSWMGDVAWGDYDNDGDLDLFIYGSYEGSDNGEPVGKLYRNDGNDTFTDTGIAIEHSRRGAVDLGDYDKDGTLDILLSGSNISGNIFSSVLKNNADNSFTNINAGLKSNKFGDNCWGDYDNDGDLDVFITGEQMDQNISRIYQNQGNGVFMDLNLGLPGPDSYYRSTSEWGDYDNDGDLDILIDGEDCIFRNDGDNQFTVISLGEKVRSPVWGDMDNDGDLDIVSNGKVYLNNIEKSNTPPLVPEGLKAKVSGNQVILSWNPSTDFETPSKGLSYNVKVGSKPGETDILSPMVDTNFGYRLAVPGLGNACMDTFKIINYLPVDTFYWSVQAVDNGYLASDFSSEQSFEVFPIFTKSLSIELYYSGLFGDYDNDGDLDYLHQEFGPELKVFRNDNNSIFNDINAGLICEYGYPSIWGDYDNDGDLDIITSDSIFRNELEDSFTFSGISFPSPLNTIITGDYDADGDMDMLTTIYDGSQSKIIIYRNDQLNIFTRIVLDLPVPEVSSWFDYDNDSDLDLISISGSYKNKSTKIYKNEGNNIFTEINSEFIGLDRCELTFADYNNDRYLDLLMVGEDNSGNYVTKIYKNHGGEIFTDINTNIRGYYEPFVFWGDFTNDGFMDIIISGNNNGRIRTKLYKNNQDETFTEIDLNMNFGPEVYDCGDYDNDGDLDLLTKEGIYQNNTNYSFVKPEAPANLHTDLKGFDCQLSWDISNEIFGTGYSYNLKIGRSPGICDIKSPVNMPRIGNVPLNNSWTIKNLSPGKYYWSVQAINQTFKSGFWAPLDSFIITKVSPEFSCNAPVCLNNIMTFTDLSITTDTIIGWKWLFGDDYSSTLQNPSHLYQTADTFDVTLWVFSQSFDSASRSHTVVVKPIPVAGFAADTVCAGIKTLFTNTSQNNGLTISSCKWDFGDGDTSTDADSVQHLYAADGSYTVQLKLMADNGCNSSFTKNIQVGKIPTSVITFSYGGSAICEGDSSVIQAVQIPQATYSYKWFRNNDLQTNALNSFTVFYEGEYKTEVTNTIGNCKSESLPVEISIYERPDTVTIQTVNYDPENCPGTLLVTLMAEPNSEHYQYRWYNNDALIAGANTPQYTDYLKDAIYKVIVGSGQCEVSSQSLDLIFKPVLPKPEIYTMGPVVWILACSNDTASEYKWYYNGILLPEARKPLLVANKQTGTYNVRISNGNGCYTSSDTILIGETNKDASNENNGTIILYPNPTNGSFNIYFQSNYLGEVQLSVYNILGKLIYSEWFIKTEYLMSDKIDVKKITPGNYILKLKTTDHLILKHLSIGQ
jgi:hypothetical protein